MVKPQSGLTITAVYFVLQATNSKVAALTTNGPKDCLLGRFYWMLRIRAFFSSKLSVRKLRLHLISEYAQMLSNQVILRN